MPGRAAKKDQAPGKLNMLVACQLAHAQLCLRAPMPHCTFRHHLTNPTTPDCTHESTLALPQGEARRASTYTSSATRVRVRHTGHSNRRLGCRPRKHTARHSEGAAHRHDAAQGTGDPTAAPLPKRAVQCLVKASSSWGQVRRSMDVRVAAGYFPPGGAPPAAAPAAPGCICSTACAHMTASPAEGGAGGVCVGGWGWGWGVGGGWGGGLSMARCRKTTAQKDCGTALPTAAFRVCAQTPDASVAPRGRQQGRKPAAPRAGLAATAVGPRNPHTHPTNPTPTPPTDPPTTTNHSHNTTRHHPFPSHQLLLQSVVADWADVLPVFLPSSPLCSRCSRRGRAAHPVGRWSTGRAWRLPRRWSIPGPCCSRCPSFWTVCWVQPGLPWHRG